MKQIEARRQYSTQQLEKLAQHLSDATQYLGGVASIFATGSYGRREASRFSDLDAFIVHQHLPDEKPFSNLDSICVKYHLISAAREIALPEFSGDGEYLQVFSCEEMIKEIGSTKDDVQNTFTARLLLLLESQCLSNEIVYKASIEKIVDAYWRDYEDHSIDFRPTYLLNDILRLWRTFCINYEARTKLEPNENRIKRKIKNYKLKHSRLMTCYSAVLYMLFIYGKEKTVQKDDALGMSKLTPIGRLLSIEEQSESTSIKTRVRSLVEQYEKFLLETDSDEEVLKIKFNDPARAKELTREGYQFSDKAYDLLMAIGNNNPLLGRVII